LLLANDVRIGIVANGADDGAIRRLEASPIDSMWVGGHLTSPNPSPQGDGGAGTACRKHRAGDRRHVDPSAVPVILRWLPKQIADVDSSTGGRLALGVGIGGEYGQEFRAVQGAVEERGRRTKEIIPLLRHLRTRRKSPTTVPTTRWRR
jgi:hypothetical protein